MSGYALLMQPRSHGNGCDAIATIAIKRLPRML
jgi:hypothetical protein